MQDKTQVFPLDKSDFIRTRLTHSLEVSSLARSMGISVEKLLITQNKLNKEHQGKLSSLLAVSGLVHDLGNPPYGHYGESAIQNFFKDWFINDHKGQKIANEIGQVKVADFINFEGNAQTFRLLSKLHNLKKDKYGYNLSVASLASILKYPRSSVEGNKKDDDLETLGVSYKKFGYLQSEKETFEQVKEFTGIENKRHPTTFLLEAADDIAYLAADLEDGVNKKVLDYEIIKTSFESVLKYGSSEEKTIINQFIDLYKSNIIDNLSNSLDNAVQNLRIMVQGFMIKSVVKEFIKRHDDILEGKYDEEILKTSDAKHIYNALKNLGYIIFNDKDIIAIELSGGQVIEGLLNLFVNSITSDNYLKIGTKNNKLYSLISDSYKDIMCLTTKCKEDKVPTYNRLLLVTDFICGMTDSYALDLYRRLNGIKL